MILELPTSGGKFGNEQHPCTNQEIQNIGHRINIVA
jgi:hypothetical protein